SGASIYYTVDGSTPTQSSTPYAGAMNLTTTSTVKAAGFKSGYNPSAVASAAFTNTLTGTTGGTTYYVATNGSDSNAGTINQPFQTIRTGLSRLHPGDTLYIRGGTYSESIAGGRDVNYPSGTSF